MDSVSVISHPSILDKWIDAGKGCPAPARKAPKPVHNADDCQEKRDNLGKRHCESVVFEEKENR
jgi:hypothetical protein